MSCGIYKITNTINNKVYIGQSIDIEKRWRKHRSANDDYAIHRAIRKYGLQNFTFSIIEECKEENLDEREIFWIEYYNSIKEGYNMIPGGTYGLGYYNSIPVEQYTSSGEYVATYSSVSEAARKTGANPSVICACCKEKGSRAGLFQWKYADDDRIISTIELNRIQRPVNQYSLDGKFLQQYKTLADAARKTGIYKSSICNVCNGKSHTAGNFRWTYDGEPLQIRKICQNSGLRKKVCQYDSKTNNLIQIYNSMTEAAKATGLSVQNISRVCQGKNKTSGGFIWRFFEENNK